MESNKPIYVFALDLPTQEGLKTLYFLQTILFASPYLKVNNQFISITDNYNCQGQNIGERDCIKVNVKIPETIPHQRQCTITT